MTTPVRILYVCVHNAGRSQMAEAFTNALARQKNLEVSARSAGTQGGKQLNPLVVQAMEEIGISLNGHSPKIIDSELVAWADRIIGMGCGVDAEACPTKFLLAEDWGLDDPAGQPIETVRAIRDDVRRRVEAMLSELETQRS